MEGLDDLPTLFAQILDFSDIIEQDSKQLEVKIEKKNEEKNLEKNFVEEEKIHDEIAEIDEFSEEDKKKNEDFRQDMQKKYFTLRNEAMRKVRREKARSLANGKTEEYQKNLTQRYCSIVLGVDQNSIKQDSFEGKVFSDLYSKTFCGEKKNSHINEKKIKN